MPQSTDAGRRSRPPALAAQAPGASARSTVALASTALLFVLFDSPAAGQVVFDNTFGDQGPAPTVGDSFLIEQDRGGTVSSGGRSHLLHSFYEFGVPSGKIADFSTDATIDTILARVTGGNASQIDGRIRVRSELDAANPDLFLLNPNGVLFGDGSRIDMGGAFFAATADFVEFADGGIFSASDTGVPLPSTASPASLLGFSGPNNADVELAGTLRSNTSGGARNASSVTLVGGDIRIQSGGLFASQATVALAAVGNAPLDVPLDVASLATRDGQSAVGSIVIGQSRVSTISLTPDEGLIVIRGGELVLQGAVLNAAGDGSMGPDTTAIDIEVARSVHLDGTQASIESFTLNAAGPGGVRVVAEDVEIQNAGSIQITNNGPASDPGRLSIEADRITLDGSNSEINTFTSANGTGPGIVILGGSIHATNQARIRTATGGDNPSSSNTGQHGTISIEVDRLELESGAQILSSTVTAGAGGDISIDTAHATLDSNAAVVSLTLAQGDGGQIEIEGETLALSGRSFIGAGSSTNAPGGDISIDVAEVSLEQSTKIATGPLSEASATLPDLLGPAGSVSVFAQTLHLEGGSQITTTTEGAFDAGGLMLEVEDSLIVRGALVGEDEPSGIFARSGLEFGSTPTGNGGRLVIEAGQLEVSDGAQISAQTFGSGDAGAIDIDVRDNLFLSNGTISGESRGSGSTGIVRVRAGRDIRLRRGSAIRSNTPQSASGPPTDQGDIEISAGRDLQVVDSDITTDSSRVESGNIRIDALESVAVVDGSITTDIRTASGQGGDIDIATGVLAVATSSALTANADGESTDAGNLLIVAREGIVRSPDSIIEANASAGISGRVVLSGPDTNLAGELGVLAADYRDDSETLRDPCQARRSRAGSFEIRPTGGDAGSPDEPLGALPPTREMGPVDGCGDP